MAHVDQGPTGSSIVYLVTKQRGGTPKRTLPKQQITKTMKSLTYRTSITQRAVYDSSHEGPNPQSNLRFDISLVLISKFFQGSDFFGKPPKTKGHHLVVKSL